MARRKVKLMSSQDKPIMLSSLEPTDASEEDAFQSLRRSENEKDLDSIYRDALVNAIEAEPFHSLSRKEIELGLELRRRELLNEKVEMAKAQHQKYLDSIDVDVLVDAIEGNGKKEETKKKKKKKKKKSKQKTDNDSADDILRLYLETLDGPRLEDQEENIFSQSTDIVTEVQNEPRDNKDEQEEVDKEFKESKFVNGENIKKERPDITFEEKDGGEVKRLENLIQEQKNMLENVKEKVKDVIDGKSDERQNINRILIDAENQIDKSNKEKTNNELKIKELEKINEELDEKSKEQMKIVEKFTIKRRKLENFIQSEMNKIKSEEEEIKTELGKLEKELEQAKNKPTVGETRGETENYQLLSFLNESIAKKEKQLECPVCLEVASPPIFMCPESHLICSECRPKVDACPECRTKYNGPPKIHRYAVEMAEELLEMIKERKKFQS